MKSYRTAESTDGYRLPHSPIVLGFLAEALRLKDAEHPKYKTAQRYFKGKRIKPENVEQVLKAVVDAAIPQPSEISTLWDDQRHTGTPTGPNLNRVALECLRHYASRWDHFVADVNAIGFPVTSPGDLPIPVLRLLALDVGIRYGAWLAVRELADIAPSAMTTEGFPDRWFAAFLDRCISERELTQEAFATGVGVTTQTLAAWRRGGRTDLPTNASLVRLARELSSDPDEMATIELQLRMMVAIQDLHGQLVELCGAARTDDMIAASMLTARRVHELVRAVWDFDDGQGRAHRVLIIAGLGELLKDGAACEFGGQLCRDLAGLAMWQQEVAADFLALPGDWTGRARYWMEFLGSAPDKIEYAKAHVKNSDALPDDMADLLDERLIEHQLRMADYDWQPGPDMKVIRVPLPPSVKAMNRVVQADRAHSVGDLGGAIDHMKRAVELDPMNAGLRFKLGAMLGELASRTQKSEFMEAALLELHIAVQLDPDFGNARNEIGIVLSNLGRREEAEDAFAKAERSFGHHAHHWLARGNNYFALERYGEARTAYEQAIRLSKDGQHVEAKSRLAATLTKLGRTRAARKLEKEVSHLLGQGGTGR